MLKQLQARTGLAGSCLSSARAVQDLCCVVSTLAALQEAGPNADVRDCLVAAKQQLQHRFEQGRDVSVPTLCQVRLTWWQG